MRSCNCLDQPDVVLPHRLNLNLVGRPREPQPPKFQLMTHARGDSVISAHLTAPAPSRVPDERLRHNNASARFSTEANLAKEPSQSFCPSQITGHDPFVLCEFCKPSAFQKNNGSFVFRTCLSSRRKTRAVIIPTGNFSREIRDIAESALSDIY